MGRKWNRPWLIRFRRLTFHEPDDAPLIVFHVQDFRCIPTSGTPNSIFRDPDFIICDVSKESYNLNQMIVSSDLLSRVFKSNSILIFDDISKHSQG